MGGVHVELYIVCLVVQPGLLHHAAINDPADCVRQVFGSIHWREAAHEGGVLSTASQRQLGVLCQNWIAVAYRELSKENYNLHSLFQICHCVGKVSERIYNLYNDVIIVCEIFQRRFIYSLFH